MLASVLDGLHLETITVRGAQQRQHVVQAQGELELALAERREPRYDKVLGRQKQPVELVHRQPAQLQIIGVQEPHKVRKGVVGHVDRHPSASDVWDPARLRHTALRRRAAAGAARVGAAQERLRRLVLYMAGTGLPRRGRVGEAGALLLSVLLPTLLQKLMQSWASHQQHVRMAIDPMRALATIPREEDVASKLCGLVHLRLVEEGLEVRLQCAGRDLRRHVELKHVVVPLHAIGSSEDHHRTSPQDRRVEVSAGGAGAVNDDAAPDPPVEGELLEVVVADAVVASVEVHVAVPEHRAVRVAAVREIGAAAEELAPDVGTEVEGEDITVAIDARTTHDVHEVVLDHRLVPVPAAGQVPGRHDVVPLLAAKVEAVHVRRVVRPVRASPNVQAQPVGHHALAVPRAGRVLQRI
mmetsp:Transcript_67460/g.219755  ORF Transcript_67460/g.219755 Transcript_67460/m.219755 type:complete len:411 (+) Transcript_67460:995-2227(+)